MEASTNAAWDPPKIRILLVDDQVAVREMLAMTLDREQRFAVVAEAKAGTDALHLFRRHRPHMVIAGLALPEMGGAELFGVIREEAPLARLLFFSGIQNRELLRAGLHARPHGFVHKSEPLETLRQAVGAVAAGSSYFSPFATRIMEGPIAREDGLSPKQRLVLQMIAEGMSTKQVAGRLSLSAKTVEHYRTQLMQKLELRDVASLTRYAVRCGLVEAE